jgi:hypothetical protein
MIDIARRLGAATGSNGHANDVAGFSFRIEVEFDFTVLKLSHLAGNAFVDRGMIRTVTRNEFQDDRRQCIGREFS